VNSISFRISQEDRGTVPFQFSNQLKIETEQTPKLLTKFLEEDTLSTKQ
jgi:hypothetical protein